MSQRIVDHPTPAGILRLRAEGMRRDATNLRAEIERYTSEVVLWSARARELENRAAACEAAADQLDPRLDEAIAT